MSNLGYATISVAPSPATSGTSLTVANGLGSLFPSSNFTVTTYPPNTPPLASNAEICLVSSRTGDVFTIVRAQEGTTAKAIAAGWQIANTATVKAFTDLQNAITAGGTVTSVGLTAPSILSVSGSPVTTSGSIGLTLVNQSANEVLSGPTGGAPATPAFRALVAADIPPITESKLSLSDVTTANTDATKHGFAPKLSNTATEYLNGQGGWTVPTGSGSGTVTSVALTAPSFLSVAGSPVTTAGSLDLTLADQNANKVMAGPATGADAAPTFRSLVEADTTLSDVTTNNVTSTAHGYAPKSPADATQFLNGATTPAFAAVKDSDLSTSDITTNNVSASKHGFAPKLSNTSTEYLSGTGVWSTPAGGGGGSSITSGTYAALPAAGTAGNVYLPTDGVSELYDTGAAWAPWGPIWPLTPLDDSVFSWVNQGTSSTTSAKGYVYLLGQLPNGTIQLRGRTKSAPSTPYTITMGLIPLLNSQSSFDLGLFFRASGAGTLATIGVNSNQGSASGESSISIVSRYWNSATSISATNAQSFIQLGSSMVWLRITDNGTNRISSYSVDGYNFITLFTVGRTSFLTADQIGFFVFGNATSTTFNFPAMTILSWVQS